MGIYKYSYTKLKELVNTKKAGNLRSDALIVDVHNNLNLMLWQKNRKAVVCLRG